MQFASSDKKRSLTIQSKDVKSQTKHLKETSGYLTDLNLFWREHYAMYSTAKPKNKTFLQLGQS